MPRKQTSIQRQINRATGASRPATRSVRNRMSVRQNPRTGNWIASGAAQGFSESRGGRISLGGRLLSRPQRYREVRKGLGLSAG